METTFSMTRVQKTGKVTFMVCWVFLQPAFSRCWAFYGRQNTGRKKAILKFILLSDFAAICWG